MPVNEEAPPVKKSRGPLAAAASGIWGCSKCKYSIRGCLGCCPEKALRYANKKEAEAEKKAKQDEEATAAEAENMAKQDEAATASVEAPKGMSLLD